MAQSYPMSGTRIVLSHVRYVARKPRITYAGLYSDCTGMDCTDTDCTDTDCTDTDCTDARLSCAGAQAAHDSEESRKLLQRRAHGALGGSALAPSYAQSGADLGRPTQLSCRVQY
eukprot:2028005-Rhodomonas_salina.3